MAFRDELASGMEDLVAEVGELVTYTPAAGAPFDLTVIVSDPSRLAEVSPGVFAVLNVMESAFSTPPEKGDSVSIRSTTCRVIDVQVDTIGMYSISVARR